MRPSTACINCRTSKRKCDRRGDLPCSPCIQRNLPCPGNAKHTPRPESSTIQRSLSPRPQFDRREEEKHLVDLYFRFIHNSPHSLFHEPTFKASVAEGTVSKPVLLAMMGMSARYIRPWICLNQSIGRVSQKTRFATQPDIVARGSTYRAQASVALKDDLENICIENVQACILVGNNFFGEGNADAESLYFGK
jgi:hypothetical protein